MAIRIPIIFDGDTSDLENDLSGAGSSAGSKFGSSFESSGSSGLSKFGKFAGPLLAAGFLAAGAAAGAAFVSGVTKAMEIEDAQAKLQAQLGATSKEAKQAGEIASRLYANAWGESAAEVTDAVASVSSSFRGLGGAELEKATERALAFSSVFDTDLPRSVQVASTVVRSGLAKNAKEAFDLLTASAQRVPAALRENVVDAAEEYSQFFATVGIGGEQAFAILAKSAEDGQFGIDKAGDAIKEFTIRATDGSATTVSAFKAIGLNSQQMSDALLKGGEGGAEAFNKIIDGLLSIQNPSKRAQQAIALFGTPLEDIGVRDIPQFLKTLKAGEKGLGDFSGSTDRAGKVLSDTASNRFTAFRRGLETQFVTFIGDQVLPALTQFGDFLNTTVAPAVTQFVSTLDTPAFKNLIADVRQFGAELVPVFQEGVAAVQAIWARFGGILRSNLVTQLKSIIQVIRGVFQVIKGIFQVITGVLTGDWRKAWEGIKNIVRGLGNVIIGFIRSLFGNIVSAFKAVGKLLISIWTNQWKFLGELAGKGIDKIVGFVKSLPGKIKDFGGQMLDAGRTLIEKLFDGIVAAAKAAGGFVGSLVDAIKNGINDALNLPLEINFDKGPIHIHATLIPRFADGVQNFSGGLALVGERGPELVNLPRGSDVIPNHRINGARTPQPMASSPSIEINQNYYGPTTGRERRRELEWTLRYATGARGAGF